MSASVPCSAQPDETSKLLELNAMREISVQLAQLQTIIDTQKAEFESRLAVQEGEISQLREQLVERQAKLSANMVEGQEGVASFVSLVSSQENIVPSPQSLKSSIVSPQPPTRRRLLKRFGGILAGAALLGAAGQANTVEAADPVGDDAVRGIGINNRGVRGTSEASDGVYGESGRGYGGVFKGGQAPLRLIPASATGAPTSGAHQVGELWLDASGKIWVCTVAGTFGTATAPVFSGLSFDNGAGSNRSGSNFVVLPQPVRLVGDPSFEALSGFTANPTDLVGINSSAVTFPIAGKAVGSATPIPSGAKAVAGVAVAISPRSNGNLRIYAASPAGSAAPLAISINYRINLSVSSYVTTALSGDGKIAVATSADCFFTFDVVGYYL